VLKLVTQWLKKIDTECCIRWQSWWTRFTAITGYALTLRVIVLNLCCLLSISTSCKYVFSFSGKSVPLRTRPMSVHVLFLTVNDLRNEILHYSVCVCVCVHIFYIYCFVSLKKF
jgi:hypothetical protein